MPIETSIKSIMNY